MAPCYSTIINCLLRSGTYSLCLCGWFVHSPQLTKGRPKPKKANRKDVGERPAEARTIRTLAGPPLHVQPSGPPAQSEIAKAAIPTPSSTRITPPATRAVGTAFHADVPTQLSTHPPTSRHDKLGPNTTDRWNGQGLIGVGLSDSATSNLPEKPSLVGLAQPLPGPSIPSPPSPLRSQAQPSSAFPRSPRRQSRIPSTGSRTLVMDVAQALQEAQASTNETGAANQSSVPIDAQRQAEVCAPPTEKRKSSFDKYSGREIPPLVEEHTATTRGINPEHAVRTEVDINADVRAQERGSSGGILSVQQDDNFIEIRE